MRALADRWQEALGLVLRLVVGGVWIWAGAIKLPDPNASVTAVRAYQLLPTASTEAVGRVLPMLEVAVGALLVLGLITRIAGGVSALLQLAFIIGIASVWARGIAINCGCFGDGGAIPLDEAVSKYPWEIARDTGLFLASAWLVWKPRTLLSLDNWLLPAPVADDPADEPVGADR